MGYSADVTDLRTWTCLLIVAAGCGVPRSGLGVADGDGGTGCVPRATADLCDGEDDDCDGSVDEDELARACGTNVGECRVGTQPCVDGAWGECSSGAIGPEAERCGTGADEDCDGSVDEGCACAPGATRPCGDTDVGACAFGVQTCGDDGAWGDCVGAVLPDFEACNEVDDDCDGETDEGVRQRSYRDGDGDGFGDPLMQTEACLVPEGYVSNAMDCDDGDPMVRPDVTEVCNTRDDDCDTSIDEGVTTTYYRDADGDGFGSATDATEACSLPAGYVTDATDCDDGCALCYPGFPEELCGDGLDNDCDGSAEAGTCPCSLVIAVGRRYIACNGLALSWSDARLRCQAMGGDLAFPDDDAEHTDLSAALNALDPREYWLGGGDGRDEGTWRTVGGAVFTECDFWDCDCRIDDCQWSGGEPNDSGGEDCLELWRGNEWNDDRCGTTQAFVCEGAF